ncbi:MULTISPECIES: hypothetical protein [Mycobacteriaceae]|jgi:hypothetical protein|nr:MULTISPECIES: hypothetical protein [Mycobacteriaceae]
MLLIELNVAGHRCTHRVDQPRRTFDRVRARLNPRTMQWRPSRAA